MTRDIGLTCICLLSNIIPDSIFYDNMGWRGGTFAFCFFFEGVVITVFLSLEKMDSVLSLWAWINLQLQGSKADGIDYPLIKFQF